MKAMSIYDNDAYVHLDIVYSKKDVTKLGTSLCSNQSVPLKVLFKDLEEHEERFNCNDNKRYGVVLTIMLDKRRSNNQMIQMAKRFASRFNNLPYYAFSKKIGKGYFLVIYFCERHYIPEGKDWPVLATSDRYASKKTGRICSKNDPDARLIYKKGQPTRKKVFAKFSIKETFFKYASKDEFKFQMGKIKMFTVDLLKEICGAEIWEDLSVKKYNVKSNRFKFQKRNVAVWNRAIRKIEKMLGDTLNGMKLTKTYTEVNINLLKNLRNQFQEMLINREFREKRFAIQIKFNKRYQYVVEDSQLFVEKFQASLQKTTLAILG